jgi:mono/diheme cytochrome c family protein
MQALCPVKNQNEQMKKILFPSLALFIIIAAIASCKKETPEPPGDNPPPDETYDLTYIEPSVQRSGDPTSGRDYLIYGNYVGAGIPYDAYTLALGTDGANVLNRTGDNAVIPPAFTAIDAQNGVRVVSANCLQCHGGYLSGDYIVGLGNSFIDFSSDQSTIVPAADLAIGLLYGNPSDEWDAWEPLRRGLLATGPNMITEVRGVNVADKLGAILAAHRNPVDFTWQNDPQIPIPDEVIPTDVPAWWLLKKKNAMFYNALGRGDFARTMMASGLLTLQDTTEAREIDQNFGDVLAYLYSLEPPSYPLSINQTLADEGKLIFETNCQICHGTYGTTDSYPNLLVGHTSIGTDPMLAEKYFEYTDYVNWYNGSWFSQGANSGALVPGDGYVAPPLDGVWATAPYLHNGSVPTLEDLLNSPQRPTYWQRTFNNADYNFTKVGWNYSEPATGAGTDVYDTTLPGYGNQGHIFGDTLSMQDRSAVIEYLKTL